jgi:hypothetical protein
MESIPEIDSVNSEDYISDDDSNYLIRKTEKEKKKKEQLMAQRLRGRLAKTERLRKESDTNYGNLQSSSDEEDDLAEYWKQIKDKKPEEVRNVSSKLFTKNTGAGRRTRKMRKSRKIRKVRKVKRVKKSKRTRK